MVKNSLKDKAYKLIKEKIVNCEYPPSSFLIETELMRQVGTSRTPIREALSKLEQENLVRILPKRGVIVCDIALGEINKIYEVRELIEPYIIRTYASKISKQDLIAERQNIVNNINSATNSLDYSVDNDLHQMLINASNNTYFIEMMDKTYTQNHRIRILSGQKVERRLQKTQEEHIAILDFLIKEDIQGAAEAMHAHLLNSKRAAINTMLEISK